MTLNELTEKVAAFEGCPNKNGICTKYRDAGGTWTIGYGFTDDESLNSEMTVEAAKEKLKNKLKDLSERVEKNMRSMGYRDLNLNQIYALTDFVFNLGMGKLALLCQMGSRTLPEVADKILEYDKCKINGDYKVLAGLTKRRSWERKLFLDNTDKVIIEDYSALDLQRLVNLNIQSKGFDIPLLTEDGIIGRKTINALYKLLK